MWPRDNTNATVVTDNIRQMKMGFKPYASLTGPLVRSDSFSSLSTVLTGLLELKWQVQYLLQLLDVSSLDVWTWHYPMDVSSVGQLKNDVYIAFLCIFKICVFILFCNYLIASKLTTKPMIQEREEQKNHFVLAWIWFCHLIVFLFVLFFTESTDV